MSSRQLSRRTFFGLSAAGLAAVSPLGRLIVAAAGPAAYHLPYPGGLTWQVVQGPNSGGSHSGRAAWSWDFRMPEGAPLMAARAGVVGMLKQDSYQSCPGNIYSCPDWNNYIVIDHGDGTSACYLHGFQNGARVRLGQTVRQGQIIGISGTTGQSGAPHLHYQVQNTTPGLYVAQSIPSGFDEVQEPGGSPVQREVYRSANAPSGDFDIRGGHFYTQTSGREVAGLGFSVSDESGVPLWTAYATAGAAAGVGYPVSRRFSIDSTDRVLQVFQRQVLEWTGDSARLRTYDSPELPTPAAAEDWLKTQTAVPLPRDFEETEPAWSRYVAGRLASLEVEPRFKEAFLSVPDAVNLLGLPMNLPNDNQQGLSLRLRYANMSINRRESRFGKPGDLIISNTSVMVLDAEPFSRQSFQPEQLFPATKITRTIPGPPLPS